MGILAVVSGEESGCGALLRELQNIWEDIEESEEKREHILSEIDKECMVVYRKKVDEASKARIELHQSLADTEAEVAALVVSLGENPPPLVENKPASTREKLSNVMMTLEKLKVKKEERIQQFTDVQLQIEEIVNELIENEQDKDVILGNIVLDEQDLSVKKLHEYHAQLRALHKEKSDRLQKVLEYLNQVHSLCGLLGLDFEKTVGEVHPSLCIMDAGQSTNIRNTLLECLAQCVHNLQDEKKIRTTKLRETMKSLFELWNIIDSPEEEREEFRDLAYILESPEDDIACNGLLSMETLEQIEAEVDRLMKLKIERMKGLILSRRSELEEECKRAHIEPEMSMEKTMALIDSGTIDPSDLLANIEAQIVKAKEEIKSRKDIMDRISKWLAACDEENWLEEYNQDTKRYNGGRGAHLNLKRAEKARNTVSKIPAMVDNLITRTCEWEAERNRAFLYDGAQLVATLEEYKLTKQRKEDERRRSREQKKLMNVPIKEKEKLTKSNSKKNNSYDRTANRYLANGNGNVMMTPPPRRVSVGGATPELQTPHSYSGHNTGYFKETRRLPVKKLNFFDIPKDDSMSAFTSISGSEPESLLIN